MRITLIAVITLSVVAPSKGMSRFSKAMPKRFFLCNRTFSHLIKTGNVHGVEAALQRGENLDVGERTAFEVAVENDQPGIAGLLVEEGAVDINKGSPKTGKTPLHLAAEKNGTALCELLIKQGADINAVDHKGRTALHYAYKHGKQNVRDLLIKRGVNKQIRDHTGYKADQYEDGSSKFLFISAGVAVVLYIGTLLSCGGC